MPSRNYYGSENSAWDFFGVKYFWSRDFWGFCWKPWGFFWVFLAPIRSSLSLEIPSTPLISNDSTVKPHIFAPLSKGIWIPESGKFLLVNLESRKFCMCNLEPWVLEFVIQVSLKKEPRIHYLECRIQPQHGIQGCSVVVVVVLFYFFTSSGELPWEN